MVKEVREKNFNARVEHSFRASDVRDVYGKVLKEDIAYATGKAFAYFTRAREVFVGRDNRVSSPSLFRAFVKGVRDQGVTVLDVGVVDTPSVYFATGKYQKPGAMITASHNPREYNGIKMVRPGKGNTSGALPIGTGTGLEDIKQIILTNIFPPVSKRGGLKKKDINVAYRRHVHSFIRPRTLAGLTVVVDSANAVGGLRVPFIFKGLPITLIPLYFRLDGTFPNHPPNPMIQQNLKDVQNLVQKRKGDMGIAFDGDMDRVVFIDEKGVILSGSETASVLIAHYFKKARGAEDSIVYSSIASKILPETAQHYGFRPLVDKVGHLFIKEKMNFFGARFGVEESGHFYYKKNYYADSGLITSMIMMHIVAHAKKKGATLSEIVAPFRKYAKSEELNFRVKDKDAIITTIEKAYNDKNPLLVEHIDGLTITFSDWWFNVRKSNNEPLLRINIEAKSEGVLKKRCDELVRIVKRRKKHV